MPTPGALRITSRSASWHKSRLFDATHNRTNLSTFTGHRDSIRRARNPTYRASLRRGAGRPDPCRLRNATTEEKCCRTQRVGFVVRRGPCLPCGHTRRRLRRCVKSSARGDRAAIHSRDLVAVGRHRSDQRKCRHCSWWSHPITYLCNQHIRRIPWRLLHRNGRRPIFLHDQRCCSGGVLRLLRSASSGLQRSGNRGWRRVF